MALKQENYYGGKTYEYQQKPFADWANGMAGGSTLPAQYNDAIQEKPGGADPVAAFLETVKQWNPQYAAAPAAVAPPQKPAGEPSPPPPVPEGPIAQPTPQAGRPHAVQQGAPGVAPPHQNEYGDYNAIAERYRQTPGYEQVTPELVQMYQEQVRGNPDKFTGVDFVDWLASTGRPSPLAGRNGYNTWLYNSAADEAQGITRDARYSMDYYARYGNYGGYGPGNGPGPQQYAPAPLPAPVEPPVGPQALPEGGPPAPVAPVQPGGPTPPKPILPGAEMQQFMPQSADAALKKLNDYYRDLRGEHGRDVMAQLAYKGDVNTGGAGSLMGDEMRKLSLAQGREGSQLIAQMEQQNADRSLQVALANLQSETQRYGIDQDAQVKQAIARLQDATSRYGIDRESEIRKAVAEIQAAASKYGADAGMAAALASAGAAADSARMGAQASMYGADRRYDADLLAVNRDIYNIDSQAALEWLKMLWMMSPEAAIRGLPPEAFTNPPAGYLK